MREEKLQTYSKAEYNVILTLEEAYNARKAFFDTYPGLVQWHRRCEQVDFRRGYTTTLFGTRRRGLNEVLKAINTPVQGTATQLCMLAMVELDRRLRERPDLDAYLVGFVHDSIEVEGPDDEARLVQIVAIIREVMEHPPLDRFGIRDLGVPLKADVHVGPSFGNE